MTVFLLLVYLPANGTEQDRRRLIIRGEDNFPPYEFLDSEGNPNGFNVELMQAVAEVMALDMEIRLRPWSEVREDIEAGRIDAVTGMLFTEERDLLVDFSTPLSVISYAIFVRKGAPFRSLEDIQGREIVIQRGDFAHDFAVKQALSDHIVLVENMEDALRKLASGRHDCAILSKLHGLYLANKYNLTNIKTVGPQIEPRDNCFAVAEGNSFLLTRLNEGLSIIKATGKYDEIHRRWFSVYEQRSFTREALNYVAWIIGPLVLLLVGVGSWSWSLKRQVFLKTSELREELTERKKAETDLRESEQRYRRLFEDSPISLLEQNLSEISKYVVMLRDSGVKDFKTYFENHPEAVAHCVSCTRIIDVNKATLALYQAESKREIYSDRKKVYCKETYKGYIKQLVAIAEGRTWFEKETVIHNFKGDEKNIALKFLVLPGCEETYDKVLFSLIDISERKRAEKELKRSREQLRDLAMHLQLAREEERTRIAREIHDELGQALTALQLDMCSLKKKMPDNWKTLIEKTNSMLNFIETTSQAVQRISTNLRPGLLDDLGLPAAIEWYLEEFEHRTGIKCELEVDLYHMVLDQDLSTAIFRIYQETLTNIARHANATQANVSLRKEGRTLVLKVRDNGRGITDRQISNPKSFGLIGMRERLYPWTGEFEIRGVPTKGTTVKVSILPKEKEKLDENPHRG